jgi:hypothetical protein
LDAGLLRRLAKDARRKRERFLGGFQKSFRKIALESTLPPHNDGATRRVSEKIESCFYAQSEFL